MQHANLHTASLGLWTTSSREAGKKATKPQVPRPSPVQSRRREKAAAFFQLLETPGPRNAREHPGPPTDVPHREHGRWASRAKEHPASLELGLSAENEMADGDLHAYQCRCSARETQGNVVVVIVFLNKRNFSFVPDEASANALDEAFGLRVGRLLAAAQRKSEPTVADSLLCLQVNAPTLAWISFSIQLWSTARGGAGGCRRTNASCMQAMTLPWTANVSQ